MQSGGELRDELAFALHEERCYNAPDCHRYRAASPHQGYYIDMAQRLITRLEPEIGIANVLPVVRIVMEETGL